MKYRAEGAKTCSCLQKTGSESSKVKFEDAGDTCVSKKLVK
jgi:hypothetical protein